MITEVSELSVSGLRVRVERKAIKNLHLGVYPPEGRVRVAAPLALSNAAVRVAIIGKLRWIRRQQAAFKNQARQPLPEMLPGESHFFQGHRYRLHVTKTASKSSLVFTGQRKLELSAHTRLSTAGRERLLQAWYREQLRNLVPPLVAKWEAALGVSLTFHGIKRMKTHWGTCNPKKSRICLNLELAKKPPECLDYIVLHEIAHLLVRTHDDRFNALLDRHMPTWRAVRKRLNAEPLAAERW